MIQTLSHEGSKKSPKYNNEGSCILLASVLLSYLEHVYFAHFFICVSTVSFSSLKIRLCIL